MERSKVRSACRNKLYDYKKNEIKIINSFFNHKEDISFNSENSFYQSIIVIYIYALKKNYSFFFKNKTVINGRLGWLDHKKGNIFFEPELEVVEENLKNIFISTFRKMNEFEKLYFKGTVFVSKIKFIKYVKETDYFKINECELELIQFSEYFEEFLTSAFYAPLTLKGIISQFSFYISQRKTYYDEVVEEYFSEKVKKNY